MGKIKKRHLLRSNWKYFDKNVIEISLEKDYIGHIFWPTAYLCALIVMETIMQKNGRILKIISSEIICSMKLSLYRNIHNVSLHRFYVFL